ncbi:MAG: hypothetical protein FWG90_10050 [Oscillospiraceae bacterium]|nr:hypothetical protein [Oscillospiraceae bacterium]
MVMFAYVTFENLVGGYEKEVDERGLALDERYAPDYVARLVRLNAQTEEEAELEAPIGWVYDPSTGAFSEPPSPPETDNDSDSEADMIP